MPMKVTIDKYDPATRRYRATGVVTDAAGDHSYFVEGLWDDAKTEGVALQLYGQHREILEKDAAAADDKIRIAGLIEAAIAKLEAQ